MEVAMEFDITLQPRLHEIETGVPGSVSACGIAKVALREAGKGTLLPAGFTNIRNIEIVSATSGPNRFPALVCLADYRGRVTRVTATSRDHLAFEIAYCNDADSRDQLVNRLKASRSKRTLTFHATTRAAREGTANEPVTAPGTAPPRNDRKRTVTALKEDARNYARRKDVTLEEANANTAALIASTPGLSAEETSWIETAVQAAWQRERERVSRGMQPTGNRRAPIRITGNRWL
jgi:hypothetical protein